MKLLNKLERKFGKIYISNLMLYIVIGSLVLFVFDYLFPDLFLTGYISFDRDLIFQGQVWRLITFVFEPYNYTPVFMLISAYFYWLIGSYLESTWGGFRFNVFYFTGIIGSILGGLITGYATNFYLNLSLFLAFAMLFPDKEFLVLFFIPIKSKYLAIVDLVFLAVSFVFNTWGGRVAILISFLNILLFFGGDIWKKFSDKFKYRKVRRNFKINMTNNEHDESDK